MMWHKTPELDISYVKATLNPILHLLEDDTINEVMINPVQDGTGQVWIIKANGVTEEAIGLTNNKIFLDTTKIQQIISFMSGSNEKITHNKRPILECKIPFYNYRFTAIMQPAVQKSHIFNIRKFGNKVYSFTDYINQGILNEEYAEILQLWIKNNFNVLIAGSVGSGKTTFANSYLHEILTNDPQCRLIILEDTPELSIAGKNIISLLTTNEVSMDDLLKVSLRLTGEKLIVGEVRDKAAYTLMKAWQTAYNGICTIHADSVNNALIRFEQMVAEHQQVDKISQKQIANIIDGIISIQKQRHKRIDKYGNIIFSVSRKITGIRELTNYDEKYQIYEFRDIL